MISRPRFQERLNSLLGTFPAVVLIGPRQIGKTTLARALEAGSDAVYRDLERPQDADQLRDVELFLQHPSALSILDEVQRVPELFAPLRGLIDSQRRAGRTAGQFLLLGSASLALCSKPAKVSLDAWC